MLVAVLAMVEVGNFTTRNWLNKVTSCGSC